jgi:cell division protein FtsW (lipid II flippase)
MGHFTDILVTKSKNFQWLLAVVMVALIGVLDYRTEPELSLALLYLVPIFQAAWFAGRYAGIFISCISAAVSIGLVTCTPPLPSENIIKEAERMMYAAKGEGKNKVKCAVLPR